MPDDPHAHDPKPKIWEYPETALREAVVNALVHRDLSGAARHPDPDRDVP